MKISRDLAFAGAFWFMNQDESVDDIAHDFKVDESELQDLVYWMSDNTEKIEESISDALEGIDI